MIPKIIHQTWKTRELPEKYAAWSKTFLKFHPDWEHRVWGDADCVALVEEHFPQHVETYHGLRNAAERADLFRYMALSVFGGLYVDIDCGLRRPLDFIGPDDEFIVGVELKTKSRRVMELYQSDLNEVYCCWAFLAKPRHPILVNLVEQVCRNSKITFSDNVILNGLKRTGPHAFTTAVKSYLDQGGKVRVLPASYLGACETRNAFSLAWTWLFPELFRKVYIRHYFETTWMDAKTKKELIRRNLKLGVSK